MNHSIPLHIKTSLSQAYTKWLLAGFLFISGSLVLYGQSLPQFEMEFSPEFIQPGETSTLTYTLTNPNASIDFVALGFVDALPAGLVVAATPNISFDCSASGVTANSGSDMITLIDAALNGGTFCTISVTVTASEAGKYQNNADLSTGRNAVTSNTAVLAVGLDLDITLKDSVVHDPSMDQIANPGDTIGYKLTIENPGQSSAFDLTIRNGSDPNTTLDPATIRATPVAINDLYELTVSPMNVPASIGVLVNDADVNDPLPNPPFNENLTVLTVQGQPVGTAQATDNGGTITMMNTGEFIYDSAGVYPAIQDSFYYKIIDSEGFEDSARVVISWTRPPVAQNDFFNTLVNVSNTFPSDILFADNGNGADDLGIPEGLISGFGGGDLGGTVEDNAPGSSDALAGGMLTVQADGSFTLANPTVTGTYTFQYRIENIIGYSDATVTISVNEGPAAQDDNYTFLYTVDQTVASANGLFADNGSGVDYLGYPLAPLISFGGGDLGGTADEHVAGKLVSLAGGDLTVNADGSWTLSGQPFTPGTYTFDYQLSNVAGTSTATVTLVIQDPPIAQKDSLSVDVNAMTTLAAGTLYNDNGFGADHLGTPAATVESYGGGTLGGDESSYSPGAPQAFAGGTITVNADGSLTVNNPTMDGDFTFSYRLGNTAGFSNADVVISILSVPVAQDDQYEFLYDTEQDVNGAAGLFTDNGSGADELAYPVATLTSFGAGDLGGTVTDHVAGSTVSLAGGDLTVNADGSWSLSGQPFTPGTYTFDYQLSNVAGTSTATVTLVIQDPPIAANDALAVLKDISNSYPADTLYADNGSGPDHLGTPAATILSFGGGSIVGGIDATDNLAGVTTLAGSFAGGTLTVNTNGSFAVTNPAMTGEFTFAYRLGNAAGYTDATVTISVHEGPAAKDDNYTFLDTVNQTLASATGLFADNGSGADSLGYPLATLISFGGGDVGGSVNDHAAGTSVNLAGGSLTVHADGSWTLSGQPFTPGIYTFDYQITNVAGSSTATVTLEIQHPPVAANDLISAEVGMVTNLMMGALFGDNGSGADHRGYPVANISFFGGGDISGSTDVTDFSAGSTTGAGTFAGGTLTVGADGSVSITNPTQNGIFTFMYRIENSAGFSDAVVSVDILGPPNGENDSAPTVLDSTSYPGDNNFHIAMNSSTTGNINVFDDNGFGPDDFGNPSALNDMNPDVIQNIKLAGVADAATGEIGGGSIAIGTTGSVEITATGELNFTPPMNFTGFVSFEYILENSIGPDITPATVTLAVGERPAAVADSYAAVGNIPIESSNVTGNGVLENDDGDNISVVAVEGSAMNVGMPVTTTEGGSVTMGSDGEFEYIPLTGFTGEDSFTYTIDNGFGAPSTTTVTITVTGIIYFMDDQATAGGDGSLNSPFKTIAEHNSAMIPNNSFLFVKDNGNSYSGNFTLKNGETVIGEGTSGNLFGMSSLTNIVLPPLSSMIGYSTTGSTGDWVQISSSGNGITLNQNNTLSGLEVGNTAGYGITDNGSSVGNLVIFQATITGTGGGISINNGGAINVTLNALNSTGNYYAIRLVNVTGSGLQVPGNVTANNSGGSTPIIYLTGVNTTSVNIGTTEGSSVSLNNHTGNFAIDISSSSAPIQFGSTTVTNSTTGNGIHIYSNPGNVSFINGGMNITTSSGTGIRAETNSGSLTISGTGNKLSATSGTPLYLYNSLISSDHLNFESITSSSGSAPAIVLNNTGSAGGLTVIGDNSNTTLGGNNSGGTIGGRTGADGSVTTGIGVYLNNTAHVHLKRMQFSGTFQNFGLRGNNVSNFSLEYCRFTGTFGTSAGADEGVVSFTGLTGTALVRSSNLSGGLEDIIRIQNTSGNLDSLIVEHSFIGLNSTMLGNDGVLVQTQGTAVAKIRISDTDFAGARGDCVQVNALGNSTAGVKLQRCDFTNAHSNIVTAGGGITLSGGDNMSDITYNYIVDDCVFSGSEGYSITANFLSNEGMITGIISNNVISNTISGLLAGGEKNGTGGGKLIHKVVISNNTITGVKGGSGITVDASRGASTASRAETYATVTNNSVTEMTMNGYTALRLLVGGSAASGDFAFVCADVSGNTFNAFGPTFAINAMQADQISSDARFNFPGYTGSANGEYGCVTGTASADLSAYMSVRGNILTNGDYPTFAGGGVDATLVCGATGSGTNCE